MFRDIWQNCPWNTESMRDPNPNLFVELYIKKVKGSYLLKC